MDHARNYDSWQRSWPNNTSSRQLNIQFSALTVPESPCPWKAILPPHLCQTGLRWGWECSYRQVPSKVQELCWQKAGACSPPAESNGLDSPGCAENQTLMPPSGYADGDIFSSICVSQFLNSKVELIHVQMNGIKISTLIFAKHLGTVPINIKWKPRRKLTIVFWVRFEWCVQIIHGAAQGTIRKTGLANVRSFSEYISSAHWRCGEPGGKIVCRHVHIAQRGDLLH